MKKICPHPQPLLSDMGEGFRVRTKTTVLNLDEVYIKKFDTPAAIAEGILHS